MVSHTASIGQVEGHRRTAGRGGDRIRAARHGVSRHRGTGHPVCSGRGREGFRVTGRKPPLGRRKGDHDPGYWDCRKRRRRSPAAAGQRPCRHTRSGCRPRRWSACSRGLARQRAQAGNRLSAIAPSNKAVSRVRRTVFMVYSLGWGWIRCVPGERAAGREFRTHVGRDIVEAGEGVAGPAGSCLLHRETPRRLAGGTSVFLQPAAHQEAAVGEHLLWASGPACPLPPWSPPFC